VRVPVLQSLLFIFGFACSFGKADDLILHGIAVIGGEKIAYLSTRAAQGTWLKQGDRLGGWRLVSIDQDSASAVVAGEDGSSETLRAEASLVPDSGVARPPGQKKVLAPESLDWHWIRSAKNPMRDAPEPLPTWVIRAWDTLTEDLRTDFRNYYRAHGWELSSITVKGDRMTQSVDPLPNPYEPKPTAEEVRRRAKPAGRPLVPTKSP
jgi:hypothetical protein